LIGRPSSQFRTTSVPRACRKKTARHSDRRPSEAFAVGKRSTSNYTPTMCGRFTYRLTWPELVRLYRLTLDMRARNPQPRYNICPTTNIDAVVERDGRRELLPMRWGLI